jgi:hypothetical protein
MKLRDEKFRQAADTVHWRYKNRRISSLDPLDYSGEPAFSCRTGFGVLVRCFAGLVCYCHLNVKPTCARRL